MRPPQPRPRARGFTLLEAALTIIIVGVGVIAAAELLTVGTVMNKGAHSLTTATNMETNIRELSRDYSYEELLAINGKTYSPAVDARGTALPALAGWSQLVNVTTVDPNNLVLAMPPTSGSRLARLTVTVSHNGNVIQQSSWLLAGTK